MDDLKILIVEDEVINGKILKKHIVKFGIKEHNIDVAINGYEALGMMLTKQYAIIFLDVKMPKCSGIEVLDIIRLNKNLFSNLHICMTTSLGGEKDKKLYNLKGAHSYIIKPIRQELVHKILQFLINKNKKPKDDNFSPSENSAESDGFEDEELIDDEFFDFDGDDEFFDFDEDETTNEQSQNLIDHANTTHKHVTAQEFLSENVDNEYFYDLIDQIDDIYYEFKDELVISLFNTQKEDIHTVLSKYSTFLNTFSSFYELSYATYNMGKIIEGLDISIYDEKKANKILRYIEALLGNLDRWKTDVFIEKTAVDVYYINASILSDVIYFEDMIKKM